MSKPAILIDYLCDGRLRTEPQTRPDAQADTQRHRQPYAHLLAGELLAWMERSPRFTAFVESYRNKIRKKLRLIRQPEAALDLRSELEAAYRLLADRRLELAYEPYASE
ncbi:MAG TPA: hypothetical protein VN363_06765, partial [Anaerolineales bacterium]|nr:hypothetical protein [Anaerolineales bacterium]